MARMAQLSFLDCQLSKDGERMAKTILVIEDEADQSKPFTQMLKYRGYKVLRAYNGTDGIAVALKYRPHLIIVDLLLVLRGDEMDGYDVIQAIRNSPDTKSIGILAWTGHYVAGKDEIRALRAGADDYIRKDTEYGTIEARIEALLRRIDRFEG